MVDVKDIKKALIEQKRINLSGNLYYKTQVDFAYNTNHIEGSTITSDETASIYDTGTILTSADKIIVLKDATETRNHFTLFKYMLDTIDNVLNEEMIKKYHFILKEGTLTDEEREWFNVGDYKKLKNYVGSIETTLPNDVENDMKNLLNWYNRIESKVLEDIIEFLKEEKYIDDNDYIRRCIEEFKKLNSLSLKEVTYKLSQKGINKNILDEYIYNNREDLLQYEIDSAKKIIIKKSKASDDIEDIKNFLYRKGYMSETIVIALDELK